MSFIPKRINSSSSKRNPRVGINVYVTWHSSNPSTYPSFLSAAAQFVVIMPPFFGSWLRRRSEVEQGKEWRRKSVKLREGFFLHGELQVDIQERKKALFARNRKNERKTPTQQTIKRSSYHVPAICCRFNEKLFLRSRVQEARNLPDTDNFLFNIKRCFGQEKDVTDPYVAVLLDTTRIITTSVM